MTMMNKKKETSSSSDSQILMKWLAHGHDQILSVEAEDQSRHRSKLLSGKLLDEIEAECHGKMARKTFFLKMDGVMLRSQWLQPLWSMVRKQTYPLDFGSASPAKKTASFCAQPAKTLIEKAASQYVCIVVGFMSDCEAEMVKDCEELAEWRDLMICGCASHALNLVESKATPAAILNKIVVVRTYFKDHLHPSRLLKESGGKPLNSQTTWNGQVRKHVWRHFCSALSAMETSWTVKAMLCVLTSRYLLAILSWFLKRSRCWINLITLLQTSICFKMIPRTWPDCVKGWLKLLKSHQSQRRCSWSRWDWLQVQKHCYMSGISDGQQKPWWKVLASSRSGKWGLPKCQGDGHDLCNGCIWNQRWHKSTTSLFFMTNSRNWNMQSIGLKLLKSLLMKKEKLLPVGSQKSLHCQYQSQLRIWEIQTFQRKLNDFTLFFQLKIF